MTATPASVLTRGVTHPTAYRGQGIRATGHSVACDEIAAGDGRHVAVDVCAHRAGRLAFYGALIILNVGYIDLIFGVVHM